jgi:hypothetical protein
MEWYAVLLFVHILSLVFWLGTDIGVFVLGKFAQNPVYAVNQRLLLLKVALILDMFPRVFMVLSLPTGFQLATLLGAVPNSHGLTLVVWAVSAVWLAVVLTGLLRHDQPIGRGAKKAERAIHVILLAILAWVSISSLLGNGPITLTWVAVKVLMYALLFVVMPLLEKAFLPAVTGFMSLEIGGSSPELEKQIRGGMDHTYIWVLIIYGIVLSSAFVGVAKPW